MKRSSYTTIDRAVDRGDGEAASAALARMTDHEKDLLVPCPAEACRALAREEGRGTGKNKTHFARRLKRLMDGIR